MGRVLDRARHRPGRSDRLGGVVNDYKEWGSVIIGSPLLTRERAEDFVEHWAKPRAEKEFPPGHVWVEQPVVYLIATAKEGRALGYEDAIPSLGPFPRMDPEGNGPGWYAWRGASCKEEI